MRRLLIMALIGWLGCLVAACGAGLPPKPGCEPGSGTSVAARCKAAVALGEATIEECDQRVNSWEAGCLR